MTWTTLTEVYANTYLGT